MGKPDEVVCQFHCDPACIDLEVRRELEKEKIQVHTTTSFSFNPVNPTTAL